MIPQRSEGAGAITPFAVPSSAEMLREPWGFPEAVQERPLRKGSQAAKHLDLVHTIPQSCWKNSNIPPKPVLLLQEEPSSKETQSSGGTLGILWQDLTASSARQGQHCAGMPLKGFSLGPNLIQDNSIFNVSLNYVN